MIHGKKDGWQASRCHSFFASILKILAAVARLKISGKSKPTSMLTLKYVDAGMHTINTFSLEGTVAYVTRCCF
jgi:hypothetical protein